MNLNELPLGVAFLLTVIFVLFANEVGFRLGSSARRHGQGEKEAHVGAISGALLGITTFMLAFTFALASDRYDHRKALVREEANAIRTAYMRSDFLPEPDRGEAVQLLRDHLALRLDRKAVGDARALPKTLERVQQIRNRLWDMAVANARRDMNSDVAALYIESLNEVNSIHELRLSMMLYSLIPAAIWQVLGILMALGVTAVGYETGLVGTRRSRMLPVLAVAFSLVIALIFALDQPIGDFIKVPQGPLLELRSEMKADRPTG